MYATLRHLKMPVEAMQAVRDRGIDAVLIEHRERLQASADNLAQLIETVEQLLEKGTSENASRISQVTIVAEDLPTSITFYQMACDASYDEEIGWLPVGRYPDDDFSLLAVADPERHAWPGGPAKFGLLVDDASARSTPAPPRLRPQSANPGNRDHRRCGPCRQSHQPPSCVGAEQRCHGQPGSRESSPNERRLGRNVRRGEDQPPVRRRRWSVRSDRNAAAMPQP